MNTMNDIQSIDQTLALFTALILCLALASPFTVLGDEPAAAASGFSDEGFAECITCHDYDDDYPAQDILLTPHAMTADPASPFGASKNQCETCHGPSREHMDRLPDGSYPDPGFTFDEDVAASDKNEICLGCHEDEGRFHWPGSTHNVEDLACVDCHDIHTVSDSVLSLDTQPAVCFDCHQEQRAMFLRQSRHPVQATSNAFSYTGLLSCTDCHKPHGSDGPALLTRNTINETCYDCHAEKRGPFLWEHAPAREDCTNCHTPHGSNYANLLKARGPWLCQQCHSAPFHPSTAYSGVDVPPASFDPRVVGKNCLNCHVQVHGSNHPSGIRLTR